MSQGVMRFDLQAIASWIEPGSKVLDLGCGHGSLLQHLVREKNVSAAGIEQDEEKVLEGVRRGLSVVQGDINEEVQDYPDGAFDYVILSQTLQQVYDPGALIRQMLRVGAKGIVSFPNFSHWRIRAGLLLTGRAPKTRELPFEWHNTPNIRVITLQDFQDFCRTKGFKILKRLPIDTDHRASTGHEVHFLPHWRALYGIYMLTLV